MIVAFLISLPVLQGGASVLDSVAEEPAAPVTEAPAAVESNSNTVTNANTAPATNAAPANTASEELGQEAPANK
jgi:hypothetical protein